MDMLVMPLAEGVIDFKLSGLWLLFWPAVHEEGMLELVYAAQYKPVLLQPVLDGETDDEVSDVVLLVDNEDVPFPVEVVVIVVLNPMLLCTELILVVWLGGCVVWMVDEMLDWLFDVDIDVPYTL